MLNLFAMAALASLLGAPLKPVGDPAAKDRALLAGTWVLDSASYAGQQIPVWGGGGKVTKVSNWVFEGGTYRATISGPHPEAGTFGLDPGKSPKHLDLIPPEGSREGPRKCLYAVRGDELTVALTVFTGAGAETAADQARAARPAALEAKDGEPILTLTFKRQKK